MVTALGSCVKVALSLRWWHGAKDPFCTRHEQKQRHVKYALVLPIIWKCWKKTSLSKERSHNYAQIMSYLIICQLLTSTFHIIFNLRNTITQKNCSPPNFYLPTPKFFTPPYTSPDLTRDPLSDQSWAPLLYFNGASPACSRKSCITNSGTSSILSIHYNKTVEGQSHWRVTNHR